MPEGKAAAMAAALAEGKQGGRGTMTALFRPLGVECNHDPDGRRRCRCSRVSAT